MAYVRILSEPSRKKGMIYRILFFLLLSFTSAHAFCSESCDETWAYGTFADDPDGPGNVPYGEWIEHNVQYDKGVMFWGIVDAPLNTAYSIDCYNTPVVGGCDGGEVPVRYHVRVHVHKDVVPVHNCFNPENTPCINEGCEDWHYVDGEGGAVHYEGLVTDRFVGRGQPIASQAELDDVNYYYAAVVKEKGHNQCLNVTCSTRFWQV